MTAKEELRELATMVATEYLKANGNQHALAIAMIRIVLKHGIWYEDGKPHLDLKSIRPTKEPK